MTNMAVGVAGTSGTEMTAAPQCALTGSHSHPEMDELFQILIGD